MQIWSLGSPDPNFTLEGHMKGVNFLDYFTGGDRPYLLTVSDDQLVKVLLLYSTFSEPKGGVQEGCPKRRNGKRCIGVEKDWDGVC